MTFKLISLNIEGIKHFDTVIPFLKKEKPDVICLQEVPKKDVEMLKQELSIKGEFFPMVYKTKMTEFFLNEKDYYGQWGFMIITILLNIGIKSYYYAG